MTDSGKKWLPGMYKTFLTRRLRRMSHHWRGASSCHWLPPLTGPAVGLPVVDELDGEVEFLDLEQGDDRLQVVLLLGRDPELFTLDLSAHGLRAFVPDDLRDLLGVVLADALLEGHAHPVFLAGQPGVGRIQRLERDAALDQLVLEHVKDRLGPLFAVGPDFDGLVAGPGDGRADAAEVEPGADLLGRLVQRVVDLLPVELGHDVEGGFLCCHDVQARRPSHRPSDSPRLDRRSAYQPAALWAILH